MPPTFRTRLNLFLLPYCRRAWQFSIVLTLFTVALDFYACPDVLVLLLSLIFASVALGFVAPGMSRRVLALLLMFWSANTAIGILRHLFAR